MQEVITPLEIFSFDGRVLKIFEANGDCKHYHVAFIQSIKLEDRGRKGHRLNIEYNGYPIRIALQSGDASRLDELIASVNHALS